jgi:urease beta subunit
MKEGDKVIKYGAVIGQATRPIRVGDHVHVHNMKSLRLAIPLNVPANTK